MSLDDTVSGMDTAIIVDSTTPLTGEMLEHSYMAYDPAGNPGLAKRPLIFKIPLYVIYEEKRNQWLSLRENTISDIRAFMAEKEISRFKTSQPSVEDYRGMYDTIRQFGFRKAIGLFLSDRMSGTTASAKLAAQDYSGLEFEFVDTKTGSAELTFALDRMLGHAKEGFTGMARAARESLEKTRIYFSVENLEMLRNTGRLPEASALLASLLHIKPIITVGKKEDKKYGEMYVNDKVRGEGMNAALPRLLRYAEDSIHRLGEDKGFAYVVNIKLDGYSRTMKELLSKSPVFGENVHTVDDTSNIMYTLVGPTVGVATMPISYR